jgi:hypothetical protein
MTTAKSAADMTTAAETAMTSTTAATGEGTSGPASECSDYRQRRQCSSHHQSSPLETSPLEAVCVRCSPAELSSLAGCCGSSQ